MKTVVVVSVPLFLCQWKNRKEREKYWKGRAKRAGKEEKRETKHRHYGHPNIDGVTKNPMWSG